MIMFLGFLLGVVVTIALECGAAFYFARKEEEQKLKEETEKRQAKLRREFNKVLREKRKEAKDVNKGKVPRTVKRNRSRS